jgi:DNA-binding transcriptional ArsR family regulator
VAAKTRTRKQRTKGTATRAEINEALRHPLRDQLLRILTERTASATELAGALEEDFERVAYHVRKLRALNCIELVHIDDSKGGKEKYYRATVRPILDVGDAEELSQLSCESTSVAIVQQILAEVVASIQSGAFDASRDRTLLRTVLTLDQQGFHEVGEYLLDAVEQGLLEIQARSDTRRAATGEDAVTVKTALLAFLPAPG